MVRVVGIEPTLHYWNRILSPARLPVPPHPQRLRASVGEVGDEINQHCAASCRLFILFPVHLPACPGLVIEPPTGPE